MSLPQRQANFETVVHDDLAADQVDLKKTRRGRFFLWVGIFFVSLFGLFAPLLWVLLVPLDGRASGPKGEKSATVVIYTDPPGAEVTQRKPGEKESTLRGLSAETAIPLSEFAKSGNDVLFKLSMPGYQSQEIAVPFSDLNSQVWPQAQHPIVRLKPEQPLSYLRSWRPWPFRLFLLSVIGLVVSAVITSLELRWLRRYERINQGLKGDDMLLGMTVLGYRIVASLGGGGEGMVYKAIPSKTLDERNQVALKIVNIPNPSPEAVARFFRQMSTCETLDHPCVMKVHAHGRQGNTFVAACELIDGGDFQPTATRADIERFVRLAEALDYLHQNSVVHRDVKAGNVMLRADGTPVLIDFGYARDHTKASVTQTGQGFGTPALMPPEQIVDPRSATGRSDQFAFAAVLYQALSGKSPFPDSPDLNTMLIHRLYQDYTPFREAAPEYPEEVHEILTRMLAREPNDRFPDVTGPTRRIRDLVWEQLA